MLNKKVIYTPLIWLLIALWLWPGLLPVWGEAAQPKAQFQGIQPHWQIQDQPAGIALTWQMVVQQGQAAAASDLASALQQLPTVRYGGYQLPMQLETVLLDDSAPVTPQFQQLESVVWDQPLAVATPLPTPVDAAGEALAPLPAEPLTLPTAPIFLLREGRVRGQRVGVLAFSPLYQAAGVTKLASHLQALLPGAQTLARALAQSTDHAAAAFPFLEMHTATAGCCRAQIAASRGSTGGTIPPPGPVNPLAASFALKVSVSQAGIQQITGGALIAAGWQVGTTLAHIHLTYQGVELPLEVRDADGTLDSTTELRFYARPSASSMAVGDRWNRTDTYWLTVDFDPGLRVTARTATPGNAPVRTTAFETGVYENNKLYESTMAGADGDHWFTEQMSVDPIQEGVPTNYDTKAFILNAELPLATTATYTSVFTITGNARTTATHSLRVDLEQTGETLTWTNQNYFENWQKTIVSKVHTNLLNMVLIPGLRPSDIRIDKIDRRQPVILSFSGVGATFVGVNGTWLYHLSGVPVNGSLYDITDPANPQLIRISWGTTVEFEDGPQARQYIVTGPGTLATPDVSVHDPVTWPTDEGADVLYIAPSQFRDALAPLVAHREKQGYRVKVIDVQDIYDAWNYGQVSPDAIRNLLRYAVYYWNPAPIAAVLVGDATDDPHDYTGNHNPNVIPAYLANVDPWQGEAPCENCYAQLDDDYPLDGPQDPDFLIDIWVGRFSVQTTDELNNVVSKILRYEKQGEGARNYSSLYIADDYIHADGTVDAAGDFAFHSDLVVTGDPSQGIAPLQSPQLPAVRVYYDPTADGVTEPWREPDAAKARLRVIDEFKKGPSLVSYNGHANHYQWASTVRNLPEPYLFGINDVYLLHNLDHLPIVLEMTCYTAQFVNLSPTGVVMDERLQIQPDGGAVAIWGSAGLTVSTGQDALMEGFQAKLWNSPPLSAKLGELTEAGYWALFQKPDCCQEVRKVYLLLGDPLTPAMVWAPSQVYLPFVTK